MNKSPLKAKPEKDLPFHLLVNFWERASIKGRSKEKMLEDMKRLFDRYRKFNLSIYPLLRLMLPWLDYERIYGLKEESLGKLMIQTLQIPPKTVDAKRITGWKTEGLGDLTDVIEEVAEGRVGKGMELTVSEVSDYLGELVNDKSVMKDIIPLVSPKELKWISRIILKKLRAKYKNETIFPIIHPNAENIFSTNPSLQVIARVFKGEMPPDANVKPGNAVLPMLAMRSNLDRIKRQLSFSSSEGKGDGVFKEPWYVELKYDGVRMQFHKEGRMMKLFTRSGKDSTKEYAALIPQMAMALNRNVEAVILDGELLVWNEEENHVEPFSQVRNYAAQSGIGKLPAGRHFFFVIFDILYLQLKGEEGVDVTRNRLKRRKLFIKRDVISKFKQNYVELAPHTVVNSIHEVEDLFEQANENEEEGIMLKKETSHYHPNTRDKNWWIKLKPDYQGGLAKDVDLLVLGGFYGEGRRGGKLATFLMGIAGKKEDGIPKEYFTIGKVGGGISEDMLEFLTSEMEQSRMEDKPEIIKVGNQAGKDETPDFWVAPEDGRVFRINATQVTLSEKFGAGVTFRHPRMEEIRFDKGYMEIMDKNELNELLDDAPQGIKRKLDGGKIKKPKKRPLTITRKGPNPADVEKKNDLLEGKTFQVFNKNDTNKEALERLIIAYGGKVLQYGNVELFTHIVTEDPTIMAVRNIIQYLKDRVEMRGANYEEMTAEELKNLLRRRREKISGKKEELIKRLEQVDKIKYDVLVVKPLWLKQVIQNNSFRVNGENVVYSAHAEAKMREKRKKSPTPEGGTVPPKPQKKRQLKARTRKSPKTSMSPIKKETYPPPKTFVPVKQKTPTPVKQKTPSPVKQKTPEVLVLEDEFFTLPPKKTPSPKTSPVKQKTPKVEIKKDYTKMRVAELRAELEKQGKSTKGTKPILLKRLIKNTPVKKKSPEKEEPVETKKDYSKMKVAELRAELEKQGKSTKGTKPVLLKRLEQAEKSPSLKTPPKEETKKDYSKMKVAELRAELEKQGKSTKGTKPVLLKRLLGKTPVKKTTKTTKPKTKDYSKFTIVQLKEELRTKNLPVGGRKAELIKRLEEN